MRDASKCVPTAETPALFFLRLIVTHQGSRVADISRGYRSEDGERLAKPFTSDVTGTPLAA